MLDSIAEVSNRLQSCSWFGLVCDLEAQRGRLLFADDVAPPASSGSDFERTLERLTSERDALDYCGVLIKNIPSEEGNVLVLKNTHCYVENRQTCLEAAAHEGEKILKKHGCVKSFAAPPHTECSTKHSITFI